MIKMRRSEERGHADHGWLNSYHTFSFGSYHDSDFMGFGPLRVLNQDRVEPAKGFGTHGHDNMEIVSFVLSGTMEHKDSMGNGSQMTPGDVQLMSAGTGVTHSEFNASDDESLHFLQMWVIPAVHGTAPRYEQAHYPESERRGCFKLIASPDGRDNSLTIGQDVNLYTGLLDGSEADRLKLSDGRGAWIHVAEGALQLNGQRLETGEGAAIQEESQVNISNGENAQFVLWELPLP